MASNILSRLLPSASDEASVYEHADRLGERSPLAAAANNHGMDIDEENLGERFQDQDLEHLLADAAADSRITTESTALPPRERTAKPSKLGSPLSPRQKWPQPSLTRTSTDNDDDNDVPESLLLEGGADVANDGNQPVHNGTNDRDGLPSPVPGPFTRQTRAQWDTTRTHHRLHENDVPQKRPGRQVPRTVRRPLQDPKERAMWLWVNVQDLDNFFSEVYIYFEGHGIWSILLSRVLKLL